ncbi:hypothetical protein ZHAS_00004099 [Anopheles sinensis]|uniref:Uncharacterized protein n=1 Tax=Anopheles sinensis TaxID=74873 RepID=A0A084VG33_ANOSI|nr:hypothetical protein ZHAS_00004099 [Anopheles sinensis]
MIMCQQLWNRYGSDRIEFSVPTASPTEGNQLQAFANRGPMSGCFGKASIKSNEHQWFGCVIVTALHLKSRESGIKLGSVFFRHFPVLMSERFPRSRGLSKKGTGRPSGSESGPVGGRRSAA